MKKLNWFETTLKHHWIHQRIKFQTVFPYSVVSPWNNLMLFLKLISGKLLAHHQRNRAPLTRSLHGYSNNAKTNWHLFLQLFQNVSLSCAEFPTELKKAFLTPLIKKIILDCEIFKNYRPVSNLSFISKLVERVVCVQLVEHLKTSNLHEIFQSAYRQLHSTETALLCVQNDLLQAIDNEGGAILVLLDLSAAFDTIDHQKLLNLSNQSSGIRRVALKWFEWYLKNRTQTVQIGSCTSTPVTIKYGVPQGSVLGPILFTMYTTPLGNIIRKHGLNFHLYADDTQLYISFQPGVSVSKETAISCLEACIKDIKICVAGSSVAVAVAFRNITNHGWVVVKFIINHQEQPCKTIQYILQTRIKHNTFNNIKTPIFTIQYIQKC